MTTNPIAETHQENLQQLYEMAKQEDPERADELTEYVNDLNNASNGEKIAYGEALTILDTVDMITDLEVEDPQLESQVDSLVDRVSQLDYIDWENKQVDEQGLIEHYKQRADEGIPLEQGDGYISELGNVMQEVTQTWNTIINENSSQYTGSGSDYSDDDDGDNFWNQEDDTDDSIDIGPVDDDDDNTEPANEPLESDDDPAGNGNTEGIGALDPDDGDDWTSSTEPDDDGDEDYDDDEGLDVIRTGDDDTEDLSDDPFTSDPDDSTSDNDWGTPGPGDSDNSDTTFGTTDTDDTGTTTDPGSSSDDGFGTPGTTTTTTTTTTGDDDDTMTDDNNYGLMEMVGWTAIKAGEYLNIGGDKN